MGPTITQSDSVLSTQWIFVPWDFDLCQVLGILLAQTYVYYNRHTNFQVLKSSLRLKAYSWEKQADQNWSGSEIFICLQKALLHMRSEALF